jgi:peptide/nickel transport system permease protein
VYERLIGAPRRVILFKHLLPNALPPVLGLAALDMGHALLSIASLGFLGYGLQPPTPEWGTMIMEARPYLMTAPWTALFPGTFIFFYLVVFTLLGRKLEKWLGPVQETFPC